MSEAWERVRGCRDNVKAIDPINCKGALVGHRTRTRTRTRSDQIRADRRVARTSETLLSLYFAVLTEEPWSPTVLCASRSMQDSIRIPTKWPILSSSSSSSPLLPSIDVKRSVVDSRSPCPPSQPPTVTRIHFHAFTIIITLSVKNSQPDQAFSFVDLHHGGTYRLFWVTFISCRDAGSVVLAVVGRAACRTISVSGSAFVCS